MMFPLFLLFILVKSIPPIPKFDDKQLADLRQRALHKCPALKKDIDFCDKMNETCSDEMNCRVIWCECLEKSRANGNGCKEQIYGLCPPASSRHSLITTEEYVLDKLADKLAPIPRNFVSIFKNNCSPDYEAKVKAIIEKLNVESKYVKLFLAPWQVIIDVLLYSNTTDECKKVLDGLDAAMKIAAKSTSMSMKMMESQWSCGWQHGDLGRTLSMVEALIFGNRTRAEQFNHCCVIQLSCYCSTHVDEGVCEEEYEKCNGKVEGSQSSLSLYKTITGYRQKLSDRRSYERAASMKTEFISYSSDFDYKGSSAISENVFYLILLPEDSDQKLTESFDYLYRHCADQQMVISSCVVMFLNCQDDSPRKMCALHFGECISNLKSVDGECRKSIDEMKLALGLEIPSIWNFLKKNREDVKTVVEFFVLSIISKGLKMIWKWIRSKWSCWHARRERRTNETEETPDAQPLNSSD